MNYCSSVVDVDLNFVRVNHVLGVGDFLTAVITWVEGWFLKPSKMQHKQTDLDSWNFIEILVIGSHVVDGLVSDVDMVADSVTANFVPDLNHVVIMAEDGSTGLQGVIL